MPRTFFYATIPFFIDYFIDLVIMVFIGEIMLELEEYAKQKGLHLIVTSFNGEYMGYITSDKWYEYNLYETTTMSWYGYQAASYITQASKDIMDALSPN